MSYLSAKNLYGLDVNSFAVEIAKVTMMIARKLSIDEFHITERALPLDNLHANFIATDALVSTGSNGELLRTPWPTVDVIIGNPPFIGTKLLKKQLGSPDGVNRLRRLYPEVPGMADYCVYWIRRAHDHAPTCTSADPVTGRIGLVGTQNIRSNQSRVGGLDHVVRGGTIIEAVDSQPWSGEANVNVSIANWVKTQEPTILPKARRLWFEVEPSPGAKKLRGNRAVSKAKQYELCFRECAYITSSLSDKTDVSGAQSLLCNTKSQRCVTGQMLGHNNFLITAGQLAKLVRKDKTTQDVTFPYLNGHEFLSGDGRLDRYVIDFGQRDQFEAAAFPAAFEWVRDNVLPDRERKTREGVDAEGNLRPHHK